MRSARTGIAAAALALVALSACAPGQPELMHLRSTSDGPDEFAILPARALELPQDLSALPPPSPGASNRADARPMDDAVLALGGKPLAQTGSVPAADAALYAQAGRYGAPGNIRTVLATEDLEFRRDNRGRLLERVLNVTTYFNAYEDQSLDQQAELTRWRRAGAATPSAPPFALPKK